MNERALVPQSSERALVTHPADIERRLGFPLRLIGQSNAPIVPQQVGPWWMEPLMPATPLPKRAAARLQALRAAGVPLRAVVVFHELPTAGHSVPPAPHWSTQAAGRARQHGASMADALRSAVAAGQARQQGASVLAGVQQALFASRALANRLARSVGTVIDDVTDALRDPCLVAVTADGQWLEVDRWYS
jgi:hypothetical protein